MEWNGMGRGVKVVLRETLRLAEKREEWIDDCFDPFVLAYMLMFCLSSNALFAFVDGANNKRVVEKAWD